MNDLHENFWSLPETEASDARMSDAMLQADQQPTQLPMKPQRGSQRPDTARKRKMRRQSAHALSEVNWEELHPHLESMAENGELHRGIGVSLPDDLHRFVHDESKPVHERAKALLNHVAGMRSDPRDPRMGLGMHWSLHNNPAEDFAERSAEHYADTNASKPEAHDFSWGRTPGEDPDYDEIEQHLHESHGIHPHDQPEYTELAKLHTHLHKGAPVPAGQQSLFPAERYQDPARAEHARMSPAMEPDEPHSKPGTSIVLHTPIPDLDDIETQVHGNPNAGGDVYHPEGHGEAEVPIRSGASIPVTGISWKPMHTSGQEPDQEPEYIHHRFGPQNQPYREAKLATVLNTQVERLNQGDQVRTPTGQSVTVHKVRPHESDSSLIYLDTDQGTSTVKRGTDFQTVPSNAQQQELPDVGNQMNSGNSGKLPMSGRTPGGPGSSGHVEPGASTPCPNCHNLGTLHAQGDMFICSVCGYTIAAGGSPGGLLFSNSPSGHIAPRRKPGEVPRAHVWGSLATLMEEFYS
jgi:hypothetical protein